MTEAIFTPEQLAEVKAYHAPYYLWTAIADPFRVALFIVTLRFLIRPLYRAAEASAKLLDEKLYFVRRTKVLRAFPSAMDRVWGEPGWGTTLLFAVYDLLLGMIIMLPLSVYFGYVLEHRHGLSNETPLLYAWRYLKATGGEVAVTTAVAFGLYGLARRLKSWWLILGIVAGLAMLGSGILDPYRAQLHYEQAPLPAGPVRERITELMAKANVDFKDVLVEKQSVATKKLQAYFAGQGPTRTIVLNDSLLEAMTPDEVGAAVAHEAGHVHENKWPGRIASSLAVIAALYLIHRLMRWCQRRGFWGITSYADIRTFPLVSVVVLMVISYSAPIAAYFSRERELKADRFAVELTEDPATVASMLIKVARVNKADPTPPTWVVWRGWSHPPISERLLQIEELKNAAGR